MHESMTASLYRQSLNPLRSLTIARAVTLLDLAMQGYYADLTWLYSFIERRDDVVLALKTRRISALRACEWSVELTPEVSQDPEAKAMAHRQRDFLKSEYGSIDNLRQAWCWLGMATFRAFAHLEKHWAMRDGKMIVKHLEPVQQWFLCREMPDLSWRYNANATQTNRGDKIESDNWIVREQEGSIGELACTRYIVKNMGIKDWATYAATFGIPNMGVEIGPDAAADQGTFELLRTTILNNFVSNGRYILPPHCKLVTGPEASDNIPFETLIKYLDTALVLAGTGGKLTMLTDATGIGQGSTGAHQDAFDEIADAEGMEIAEVLDEQHGRPALQRQFPGEPVLVRLAIRRNRPVSKEEGVKVLTGLKSAGWDVEEADAEKLVDMPLAKREEPAKDWSKVKDQTEDQDIDNVAKNRSSEGMQTVMEVLRKEGEEVVQEFEAALEIQDPHERGAAILKVIERIPKEIDKSDDLTAAIETLLLDGFAGGDE